MPPRLIWRITRVYEHRFRVIPQQNQTPECGCISLTWWIRSYVSQVLTWGNWQSTINGTKVTCSRRSCLTKGRCMGSWLMLGWNNRNTVTHTHIERFWLPSRFYIYQFTTLPKCHHRVSQGTDGEGVSEPGFKDFAASCRKHGYETCILDIHLTFWTICKYPDFGLGAGSPVPASTGAASSHRDRFLESSNTGSRDDSWYCV